MNGNCGDSSRAAIPCQVHFVQLRNESLFGENGPGLLPLPVAPSLSVSSGSAKPCRGGRQAFQFCCFSSRACLPAAQGLLLPPEEPPSNLPPLTCCHSFPGPQRGALSIPHCTWLRPVLPGTTSLQYWVLTK